MRPAKAGFALLAVLFLVGTSACNGLDGIEQELREGAEDVQTGDGSNGGADGAGGAGDGGLTAADDGPLGANAAVYLRADFPKAVVEVDAVEGQEPSGEALGHLGSVFRSVADKPDGVEVRRSDTFDATGETYSTSDLQTLETEHRTTSSGRGTASLYVLVLNGSYAEDENALGVAYSASSVAIFRGRIGDAAGLLGSVERIERSVVVHELGHVLRLVNVGYDSPRGREDPEHPRHSTNEDSVMFWAVESSLVSQVLNGPPPDDFDDADRADLADIKAGSLPA